MNLPHRAGPLLLRLDEFFDRPELREFRRKASDRFAGADRLPEPEDVAAFRSYAIHGYREPDGRGLVDLFLVADGSGLSPEEREAIRRFADAVFGFFVVEEVRIGEGFRARCLGRREPYEVVEVEASKTLRPRHGFFGWLVPYLNHYELLEPSYAYSEEMAYTLERITRLNRKESRSLLSDPVCVQRNLIRGQRAPAPPANSLEAEILAGQVFADMHFPLSVEEVQRRFQTMERPFDLLRSLEPTSMKDEGELRRFLDCLSALWNHTPRDEFQGQTPDERYRERLSRGGPELPPHLAQDLLTSAAAEVGPSAGKDPEKVREAMQSHFERWLKRPQKELGGQSPKKILEGARIPVASLDPQSLPAPGRPFWSAEALEGKAALLLEGRKCHGIGAVVLEMAERGQPISDALLGVLFRTDDSDFLDETIRVLADRLRMPVGASVAKFVASRIDRLADPDCLGSALRLLADHSPEDGVAYFREILKQEDSAGLNATALRGLVAARAPEAVRSCIDFIDDESPYLASAALACLIRSGDANAVRSSALRFLARLARDSFAWSEDCAVFLMELEPLGLGRMSNSPIRQLLFPGENRFAVDGGRVAPKAFSALCPEADTSAAKRFRTVFRDERRTLLERYARKRDCYRLSMLFGEMAREAISIASRENALFGALGTRFEALVEAVEHRKTLVALSSYRQEDMCVLLGHVFLKAVRGRDMPRELEAAGGNPSVLEALLCVDEAWFRRDLFSLLARHAAPERLEVLSKSRDIEVKRNALALLVARDPARNFARALETIAVPDPAMADRFRLACEVAGDAFLDAAVREIFQRGRPCPMEDFLGWLSVSGTERAGAYLSHYLDAMLDREAGNLSIAGFVEQVPMLLDSALARRLVEALRSGRSDADVDSIMDDSWLRPSLQVLQDLTGVPEDVEALVEERLAACSDIDSDLDAEPGFSPGGGGLPDDPGLLGDLKLPPELQTDPEARRVMRNDPCPCGSGKKYKNCCGKLE